MMRNWLLLALLLLGVSAGAAEDAAMPRPFTAVYDVTYRGMRAGALTFQLQRENSPANRYTFETRAQPSALARLVVNSNAIERSVLEIGPDGVRPLRWQVEDGKADDRRDGQLTFDWDNGVVSGVVERERVQSPLETGVQDRLSIQIAVSTLLLRGESPGTVPLVDDHRIKRYTYSRKEASRMATPLGDLDVILFESTREGSSRVSRLWLAPKLDYAPVRAEQVRKGKVETVMVMREWNEQKAASE